MTIWFDREEPMIDTYIELDVTYRIGVDIPQIATIVVIYKHFSIAVPSVLYPGFIPYPLVVGVDQRSNLWTIREKPFVEEIVDDVVGKTPQRVDEITVGEKQDIGDLRFSFLRKDERRSYRIGRE